MPSSAAVYGDLAVLPLTEDLSGMPSSFYGLTKLTAEGYLRIYHEAFGLNTVCFRYANVYGPRQGDGGEAVSYTHLNNDTDENAAVAEDATAVEEPEEPVENV